MPPINIRRATVFAIDRIRSSSVARYASKDVDTSSKKTINSTLNSGAPLNSASDDASKNKRMLYIRSFDSYVSGGFELGFSSTVADNYINQRVTDTIGGV